MSYSAADSKTYGRCDAVAASDPTRKARKIYNAAAFPYGWHDGWSGSVRADSTTDRKTCSVANSRTDRKSDSAADSMPYGRSVAASKPDHQPYSAADSNAHRVHHGTPGDVADEDDGTFSINRWRKGL